jgi:hypothetical protein
MSVNSFVCFNKITPHSTFKFALHQVLRLPNYLLNLSLTESLQQLWHYFLNYVYPNPPCQLSLWEETGVPGENPRLSAECWQTLFTCLLWQLYNRSPHWFSKGLPLLRGSKENSLELIKYPVKIKLYFNDLLNIPT